MTERQMEDLIAQFPDEFFSSHGLVLKGRQKSFAEVGRFDLLFVDSFQTNVLMELKATTAKYEDASQLAKYKDALNQSGQPNILMWLVAPQIPNTVREFLDRIGIEYSEIHEAQFRRVAERHEIKLDVEEAASTPDTARPRHPTRSFNEPRQSRGPRPECPYTLNTTFDRSQLDQLLRPRIGNVTEVNMAKVVSCKDVGVDCDFVMRGETTEDILQQAAEHARTVHNMTEIPPDVAEKLRGAIRDEAA